jgi:CRISPR-associated protein Cas2
MPEPARLYLVLYDIASPRRWRKVYSRLKAHGAWTQFSAFFCRLEPRRMARLRGELAAILDMAEDRLLICDLGEATRAPERLDSFGAVSLPRPPETLILI